MPTVCNVVRQQLSSVHCVFISETLQNKGALHPVQAVSLSFTFQLNRNVCALSRFSFYHMTTSVLAFLITQTLTLLDLTFRVACPTKPVSSWLLSFLGFKPGGITLVVDTRIFSAI